jgi:hypothetical protein
LFAAARLIVARLMPYRRRRHIKDGVERMDVHIRMIMLQPIVALIAGILILLMPRLLNFIVAIYLIIIGVTGLWPNLMH